MIVRGVMHGLSCAWRFCAEDVCWDCNIRSSD